MKGKLQDFSPGELIQTIGLLAKSGALRLQNADEDGLVVFRTGKIIFTASASVRENLGSLLLRKNLINEGQLIEALERQVKSAETKRLGNVLVEMGVLQQPKLEEVVREQFSVIISQFFNWSSGEFSFECLEVADHGEVELESEDFLATSGVESTHVLLDAARRVDERQQRGKQAPAPEAASASLDTLLNEVTSPMIRGETVYRLLDLGGEVCGRCLLFAVHPSHFQVVGQFGFDESDSSLGKRLSDLEIPREIPSILARAVDKRHSILAKLPTSKEDEMILEALGGPSPTKSLALPITVGEEVILILYGDHLSDDLGTGRLDELELGALKVIRGKETGSSLQGGVSLLSTGS